MTDGLIGFTGEGREGRGNVLRLTTALVLLRRTTAQTDNCIGTKKCLTISVRHN